MGVLVSQDSTCPLCRERLRGRPIFNFTFVEIEDPRLAILDDRAVHRECLQTWELRDEFVSAWNAKARACLGPTWILKKAKNGTLEFGREPFWQRILGVVLAPCFWLYWKCRRACDWISILDWRTYRKRRRKCKNCGTRLLTAHTKQCFNCGMDWHDERNVVFREKE